MADDDLKNDYLEKSLDKLDRTIEKVGEKCENIDKSLSTLASRFESHLGQDEKMYVEFKHMVEMLHDEFKRMVEILDVNTQDVKYHIHRTDILQELYEKMEARMSPIEQERLKKAAVREFVMDNVKKWSKILGLASLLLTITYYILKIKLGV